MNPKDYEPSNTMRTLAERIYNLLDTYDLIDTDTMVYGIAEQIKSDPEAVIKSLVLMLVERSG